jgi:DNA sulfur modification protein DndB
MTLKNLVITAADRMSEFKRRNRDYDEQSVTAGAVQDYEPKGWTVARELKTGFKLRKLRTDDQNLENRFWCCMYRLGYPELNAGRHFKIPLAQNVEKQIDVFARDAETILIAECKTADIYKKKSLQKDLAEFDSNKRSIANALRDHYGRDFKPKIIWLFVLSNVAVTQQDQTRARELKIHLLSDKELTYFEEIAKALGPAARQQFKAEYLAGQEIPALENVSVPAVKTKLNDKPVYVFSAKASDMSRIGFVNHRDLRDPNSAPTYQRLVNPNRLKKVVEFLKGGGYFPNSILVNFQYHPRFDLALHSNEKGIQFGHLYLPTKYKSVKVIDGQHRLYGCSLIEEDEKEPNLFFVAFDGISGTEEANLFATINKEQQKVQKRLLDELDGELKWDSEIMSERVQAICSRAIDLLNAKYSNPFEDMVVSPGLHASDDRPLTLPEIRKAIISANLICRVTSNDAWAPGPFFCFKKNKIDNEATLDRLMESLSWYFNEIRSFNRDRWEFGKSGRICNNFGVPGYIRLLSEIIRHIEKTDGISATDLTLRDLHKAISPFLAPLRKFVQEASDEEFDAQFNVKLGSGGVKQYYFALSKITNSSLSDFKPTGFEQWLSELDKEQQEHADKMAKWIQDVVHRRVVETLKREYGENFFDEGISNKDIQVSAYKKRLDDEGAKRGGPERYLDFVDLRKIVEQKENWPHFECVFNIPLPNQRRGLAKYVLWFEEVNRIRRVSAHPYERTYSESDLRILQLVSTKLSGVGFGHPP